MIVLIGCINKNVSNTGSNYSIDDFDSVINDTNKDIFKDSVFSIQIFNNIEQDEVSKIILRRYDSSIFVLEETRINIGKMVNYKRNIDSFYFQNPVQIDSFVIFITTERSNQICNIINIKNGNKLVQHHSNYFFFINDFEEKSIIYFAGDKYNYWENETNLAELVKISYDGSKTEKVHVPFRLLMDSYNLFENSKIDKKSSKLIMNMYKN